MVRRRSPPGTAQSTTPRWGQQQRLEFIDFRLYWEGRINRADLTGHFGISIPQASLDLAKYQELAPRNLSYERSEKVYLATSQFKPVLVSERSNSYLDQLLMVASGALSKDAVFIGWTPSADLIRPPQRRVSPAVLLSVLRSIRQELTIDILYQSFERAAPTERVISPHAIAFDGFRWHARAFCHTTDEFSDFALSRVLEVRGGARSRANPHADRAWETFVEVKVAPNPHLPESERQGVEFDYGMTDGAVTVPTRLALLPFLLNRLGISPDGLGAPKGQLLVLANTDKLAAYLQPK
jgi:hypothetical protein